MCLGMAAGYFLQRAWLVNYTINDKYTYTELIDTDEAPDYWAALRVAQYRVNEVEQLLSMNISGLMRVTGIQSIREVLHDG